MSLKNIPIEWDVIFRKHGPNFPVYTDCLYEIQIRGKYSAVYSIIRLEKLGYCFKNTEPYYMTLDELSSIAKHYMIVNYFLEELTYFTKEKTPKNLWKETIEYSFNTVMVYTYNIGCTLKLEGLDSND